MILISTSITWWYPIITRIAWWYHSPQVVYDGTHDLTRCMTKSLITSLVYNDTWYYQSSHSLLDDIWSTHTLLDDSIHLKLCMMIPIITMMAWWYPSTQTSHDRNHSSQALHDHTIPYKPCRMIHSSQALHGDTYHRKPCIMNLSYPAMQYGNNWRDETQGLWRTTEDSRECSLDSLLETAGHLVNLTK